MKKFIFTLTFILFTITLFGKTQVIAHRGYWQQEGSAKNSISSLKNAQDIGVYGSELDVQITSDGIPVVNHDDSIQGLDISNTSFRELKQVKLENGETIPTLKAYLIQGKKNTDTKLIIEIKNKKEPELEKRTVQSVVDLVSKFNMEKNVEYISFSMNICKELKLASPNTPIAYLAYKEYVLSPEELKEIGLSGLDYHYSIILQHPEFIEKAKSLGLSVNVWTVNDSQTIQEMIDMNVDYITTDEPKKTMEYLKPHLQVR